LRAIAIPRFCTSYLEDQELDAVQIESTRTIDIDQFVPKSEIDERYVDSPYYLAPDGKVGQDANQSPMASPARPG
jgi:non-homologous end joining protein Ku